jgi:cardiolipin synthase
MLIGGRYAQTHDIVLQVNWIGRWGVWPTMSAIFAALVDWHTVALVMLYIGIAMSYAATAKYYYDAQEQLQQRSTSG